MMSLSPNLSDWGSSLVHFGRDTIGGKRRRVSSYGTGVDC